MSSFFSAPGILLAPKIDLDVRLDPFQFQGISDTAFETVQIDIPVEPIITFPVKPNVIDPEQPVAPEISLSDFTPEQLLSLEVNGHCQDKVDIALPGALNLPEWTDETPVFTDPEPSGRVDWEYEEFSYALSQLLADRYDLLVLPTEYLSRLDQRNQAIWDNEQDWIQQRGNDNSYLKRKNIDNRKNLNMVNQWTVVEQYKNDISLKKLFIAGRQSHEDILRRHHDVKQKLNFSFVQSVMDNGVKHYNACLQAFSAKIATYRELASIYLGDITRQQIKIQELQARFTLSQNLGQYNSAVLARLQSEIAVQKGVIQFFQSQMSLAKAELQVEVLQAQIERLEIQIFAELNRALVDEIRQDIAEQEAEIAKVQVVKLEAIKNRLLAQLETAQVNLTSAREEFAGERAAFNTTQQARSEQHGDFPRDVTAREDLINAQLFWDQARGTFSREAAQDQERQLELNQDRLERKYDRDFDRTVATAKTDEEIAENNATLANARVRAREDVRQAELDAQRTLAKSDITQSLIHQLAEG